MSKDEFTTEPDAFTELNEKTARKIQLRLINKLYREMEENPSASLFAVVERQLARLNMGLITLIEDEEMTEEEKGLLKKFEEMGGDMDSDLFGTEQ